MKCVITLGGGLYVKTIRPCTVKYCKAEDAHEFNTPHSAQQWASERFTDYGVELL